MSHRFTAQRCHDCGVTVHGSFKDHHAVCQNSRKQRQQLRDKTTPSSSQGNNADALANSTDVYFLLDVSGSMAGQPLEQSKVLATELVGALAENDRMAIVTFDSGAFFKLQPRPVGQIRRQGELPGILNRIFAQGATAMFDAIYLALSDMHRATSRTCLIVLTDGQDNASRRTMFDIQQLQQHRPNTTLHIIYVNSEGNRDPQHQQLCDLFRGQYHIVPDVDGARVVVNTQIVTTITTTVTTTVSA